MAITKIPALGAAIRAKVGVTEEKSVPQLTDIVKEQLITRPTGSQTIIENGTYDVAEVGEVVVDVVGDPTMFECWEWCVKYGNGTDRFTGSINLKKYPGVIPPLDLTLVKDINTSFRGFQATKIQIIISDSMQTAGTTFADSPNLKTVSIEGSTKNITDFGYCFENCTSLETIEGEFDFSGVTSSSGISTIFNRCSSLKEIHIKPFTLNVSHDLFIPSATVNDQIALAVINGLSNEPDTAMTTTWGSSVKQKMGAVPGYTPQWFCVKDESTGIYNKCESTDPGAIPYAQAISEKGWTIP